MDVECHATTSGSDSVSPVVNLLRNLTKAAPEKVQHGVDVSAFQGAPASWSKQAGSFTWAAVKITELEENGTRYVNPYAAADWSWLASHQKGRIAYLFGHPSVSAADTVDFFVTQLDALKVRDTDGIALDLEVNDGLSAAKVAAWGVEVQAELEHHYGRLPLLYTYLSFAEAGNCAGLGEYPLWIADPSSAAGHPRVPGPWKSWTIHQYDISGSIDLDVAKYSTEAAMFAALGKTADPKEPDVKNLGGSLVTGLTMGRWADGQAVLAGLGENGYIQAALWGGKSWSHFKNISPTKAQGTPAVTVWIGGQGRLYYIDESHNVIQLETVDHGRNWT
jgi:GH25 family lysozyme M1 (1,4-beta-N-acetylmuramidase)